VSAVQRFAGGLLLAGLLAGLSLAALRMDLFRIRYQLADLGRVEKTLREEKNRLTVEMRQLRDPARLAARAEELGFTRPERVIDLPLGSLPPSVAAAAPASIVAAVGVTRP
jgi:hypothetical protein